MNNRRDIFGFAFLRETVPTNYLEKRQKKGLPTLFGQPHMPEKGHNQLPENQAR
jgi:hypothetical protein